MNSDKVIFNKVSNPPFRHHQHLSEVLFGFIICEESFKRVFSSSLNLFWGIPEHVFFKRGAIQYSEIQKIGKLFNVLFLLSVFNRQPKDFHQLNHQRLLIKYTFISY
jgi:hypothetical protein